jgi:hypothetical protein
MDTFIKESYKQHQGHSDLKKLFVENNEQIFETFHDSETVNTFLSAEKGNKEEDFFLLLIEPVVEVAWADGRVTSREMDALIQIADSYGLVDCQETYCKLMNNLVSRPIPKMSARSWERFYKLLDVLSTDELRILSRAVSVQAQFVAERSSNNLFDYLRGDSICQSELSVLDNIKEVFKRAELDKKADKADKVHRTNKDFDKLLPLIPLIKVAWAEGRVTNREKQIIFAAAGRWGIKPESPAYDKLSEWLELHPTDDFYNQSLQNLRTDWQRLDGEDRILRQIDLLSDCTLIAEASGGNSDFPAGGPRVCDEEIFAVKQIARKLKFKQQATLS